MTQQHTNNHAEKDTNRLITDDYECFKDCRNCPFPAQNAIKPSMTTITPVC